MVGEEMYASFSKTNEHPQEMKKSHGFLSQSTKEVMHNKLRFLNSFVPGEELTPFVYQQHITDLQNGYSTQMYGFLSNEVKENLYGKIRDYGERHSKMNEEIGNTCHDECVNFESSNEGSDEEFVWSDSEEESSTDQCLSADLLSSEVDDNIGSSSTRIDDSTSHSSPGQTAAIPLNISYTLRVESIDDESTCVSEVLNFIDDDGSSSDLWVESRQPSAEPDEKMPTINPTNIPTISDTRKSFAHLEDSFKSLQDAFSSQTLDKSTNHLVACSLSDTCADDNDQMLNDDDGYSSIDPWDEELPDTMISDAFTGMTQDSNTMKGQINDKDYVGEVCILNDGKISNDEQLCIAKAVLESLLDSCVKMMEGIQEGVGNSGPLLLDSIDCIQPDETSTVNQINTLSPHHLNVDTSDRTNSSYDTELNYKYTQPPITPPPFAIQNIREAINVEEDENVLLIERSGERRRGSCTYIEDILSVTWVDENMESNLLSDFDYLDEDVLEEGLEEGMGNIESHLPAEVDDSDVDISEEGVEDELLKLVDKKLEKVLEQEERRGQSTEVIKQKRLSQLIEDGDDVDCPYNVPTVSNQRRRSLNKFQAIANKFS